MNSMMKRPLDLSDMTRSPSEEADYRAYIIGADGRFSGFHVRICASDEDAASWAKQLQNGRRIELWSEQRLIVTLEI
jgi:hypothetical protein